MVHCIHLPWSLASARTPLDIVARVFLTRGTKHTHKKETVERNVSPVLRVVQLSVHSTPSSGGEFNGRIEQVFSPCNWSIGSIIIANYMWRQIARGGGISQLSLSPSPSSSPLPLQCHLSDHSLNGVGSQ